MSDSNDVQHVGCKQPEAGEKRPRLPGKRKATSKLQELRQRVCDDACMGCLHKGRAFKHTCQTKRRDTVEDKELLQQMTTEELLQQAASEGIALISRRTRESERDSNVEAARTDKQSIAKYVGVRCASGGFQAYCPCMENVTGTNYLSHWTTPELAALAYGRHTKTAQHQEYEREILGCRKEREEAKAAKAEKEAAQRAVREAAKAERERERQQEAAAKAAKPAKLTPEEKAAARAAAKAQREAMLAALQAQREAREKEAAAHQQRLFREARERAEQRAHAAPQDHPLQPAPPPPEPASGSWDDGSLSVDGAGASEHDRREQGRRADASEHDALLSQVLVHEDERWRCLGLRPGAPVDIVRKRFLLLAKRLHPDKKDVCDQDRAHRAFKAVERAYQACMRQEGVG